MSQNKINFIPFNVPSFDKYEKFFFLEKIKKLELGNYGSTSKYLEKEFYKIFHSRCILTHSCTAALEMCAILMEIKKNDEIIVPSYAYVSTANAFAILGAKIVFADIKFDDLNIDEKKIEELITKKTKALVILHYNGVASNLRKILNITKKHKLFLIEDAAQGFLSKYQGKYLGTFGDFGTFSFHETKNITSGQGGALLINNEKFLKRAYYIRDKGTNRIDFDKKKISKYSWVDLGSSFTMGEISAAILKAQIKKKKFFFKKRQWIWKQYYLKLKKEDGRLFYLPKKISKDVFPNTFFIILKNYVIRDKLVKFTKKFFDLLSHYEPLHLSLAGKKYGIYFKKLIISEKISKTIIRLPMFYKIKEEEINFIAKKIISTLNSLR